MKRNRAANYYISLTNKLKEMSSVISIDELYVLIDMTDSEFGFRNATHASITKRLESLLGTYLVKTVDETKKRRGRDGKSYFFQLSEKYNEKIIKKRFIVNTKAKSTKTVASVKPASTPKKKELAIRKTTLDTIWTLLSNVVVDNNYVSEGISLTQLGKLVHNKNFSGSTLDALEKNLNKIKMSFHAQVIPKGNNKIVYFSNIKNTVLTFAEKYKQITGETLEVGKLLKQHSVTSVRCVTKTELESREKTDADIAMLYFHIAGIIELEGNSVEVSDLCTTLRKQLGHNIGKYELIELVKKVPEFKVIDRGGYVSISLKDKDTSWDIISGKFSPMNAQYKVMACISMSLKEVNSFIQADIIRRITPDTAIYEITFDGTLTSFNKLCRLRRTFRGIDVILDKEIEERLVRNIAEQDGRANNGHLALRIEKLNY